MLVSIPLVVLAFVVGAAASFKVLERGHANAMKAKDAQLSVTFEDLRRTKDRLHLALTNDELKTVIAERNDATLRLRFLERKFTEDPTREKELVNVQAENTNLRADRKFWRAVALGEKKRPQWDEEAPRSDPATPCPGCTGTSLHAFKCALAVKEAQGAVGTTAPLDS